MQAVPTPFSVVCVTDKIISVNFGVDSFWNARHASESIFYTLNLVKFTLKLRTLLGVTPHHCTNFNFQLAATSSTLLKSIL